jgi:hypothetical protein
MRQRLDLKAENHPNWKGDNVSYKGLHKWVRDHLPQPELCQSCNLVTSYDLANITGKYTKDFSNWKYLCRPCHIVLDRMIDMSGRKCSQCGSTTTDMLRYKCGLRPYWRHDKTTGQLLCNKCNRLIHSERHKEYLRKWRIRNPDYNKDYYLKSKFLNYLKSEEGSKEKHSQYS